jgi:hypothetical protein
MRHLSGMYAVTTKNYDETEGSLHHDSPDDDHWSGSPINITDNFPVAVPRTLVTNKDDVTIVYFDYVMVSDWKRYEHYGDENKVLADTLK